jgi:hypothetical protein
VHSDNGKFGVFLVRFNIFINFLPKLHLLPFAVVLLTVPLPFRSEQVTDSLCVWRRDAGTGTLRGSVWSVAVFRSLSAILLPDAAPWFS